MSDTDLDYALAGTKSDTIFDAPDLSYRPPRPKSYRPKIGLIGCGGITGDHLRAYRQMGLDVVALCDLVPENAEARRRDLYPQAAVYSDFREVLARKDIDVIDAATHPKEREAIIDAAIAAGKHVLSQKPFVADLETGMRLAKSARKRNVVLAVNQNGRWAPHFSYMRHAIAAGLVGEVSSVEFAVHWDHNWIAETPFNRIPHVLFYDFAIHWFDILSCFMRGVAVQRVYATARRGAGQRAAHPLIGSAVVEFPNAVATMAFAGSTQYGAMDRTVVAGSNGTLVSMGPDINQQSVTLYTAAGQATPKLEGTWFTSGFEGTMGELLCAVEEGRAPYNSAESNLASLEVVFAAIESAETGRPIAPGAVRRLEDHWFMAD